MAADAGSEARGDSVSRGGDVGAAQGRLFEGHDTRDGEGVGGNARRCAGSHRHDVLHGRRGAQIVWADDAFGVTEQIRDERAAVDWCRRTDYTMEFSDGDSVVEDDAGADLREYSGAEAGGG